MQRQIGRCFMVCGPVVSSSRVYDWVFARKRKLTEFNRFDVWRILIEIAEPVGRAETIGRPGCGGCARNMAATWRII